MELLLKRMHDYTVPYVQGELLVNGVHECFTIEDQERDLGPNGEGKVHGETAIPVGKYDVAITFSNRFQKYLPLLIAVPHFEGIRIHPGNAAKDTDGCIIVGDMKGEGSVISSRSAFVKLFAKMKAVEKKEKITIEII